MRRIDRKRAEALTRVLEITGVLTEDLWISAKMFQDSLLAKRPASGIDWDLAFFAKTAVRALFAHVEDASQVMRITTAELAEELDLGLTRQQTLELLGRRETRGGSIVDLRLSPLDGWKLAAKRFPAVFGVEYQLEFGPHWQALSDLLEVRKGLTHPAALEDLVAVNAFPNWQPGFQGYLSSVGALLTTVAAVVPDADRLKVSLEPAAYRYQPPIPRIFKAEGMSVIASHPLSTLDYFKEALFALMEDTGRSMRLSRDLSDESSESFFSARGQFAVRNWVRTLVSEMEGTRNMVAFFVRASAGRSEFAFVDDDQVILDGRSWVDALERSMEIWAEQFGKGVLRRDRRSRDTIYGLIKLRDRLQHPKSGRQLAVSLQEINLIMGGEAWFRELTNVMELGESWSQKARASVENR